MLALSAYPLNVNSLFLDRRADAPGAQVAPILLGELEDPARLAELAARSDVLTFDWENISGASLKALEHMTLIRPPRAALEVCQDRLQEKALLTALKIPVAAHAAVDSLADLERAVRQLGARGILKTRRLGYDGKGQFALHHAADLPEAWARIGQEGLIYERFQDFSREVSIIGARSATGQIAYYPLAANTHAGGVLRYTVAPYANPPLERLARRHLKKVMEHLDYVGVLTIEYFVVEGRLVANEMAPRVHNSGHWTIEGAVTSQFANHIRAICDLPLGSTRAVGHGAMVNFLGNMPPIEALLSLDGVSFHDYGKEPRPGRKLGHCTILKGSARERNEMLKKALQLVKWT
jgi:5-(carboxyamino)imidazole ribonucleotide synthase